MSSPRDVSVAFAGVVLCGGESKRMGRPKHTLPFGAETLLERVTRLLGESAKPIVVVAGKEQPFNNLSNNVVVIRDSQKSQGPLEGVARGLEYLKEIASSAFVTSCDAPFVSPRVIAAMRETHVQVGSQIMAPWLDGRFHPLAAIYATSCAAKARELLEQGKRSLQSLCVACDARRWEEPEMRRIDADLRFLTNINTREKYEQALAWAGFADPR